MTYKVLSIKWRPETFDDVVGQKHITNSLQNALKLNRVSHAFTFCGPRGVGKTTVARILAKDLNKIDSLDKNFDIYEMDAASNRGIDEIRSLRENIKILPVHGDYKIYIIDEVHMLTKEAFNALLKTLEEPPEYVKFILATTDPYKLPLTILSRTQRYDFKRINIDDIIFQLEKILDGENVQFDNDSLKLIAQKADGSMRDAISCLDQTINFCSNNLTYDEVRESLGVVDEESYFKLLQIIVLKDSSEILKITQNILDQGVSVDDFIVGFNKYLQKILQIVVGIEIEGYDDVVDWIKGSNNSICELYVVRIMELCLQFLAKLKFISHQPDIALEILMLKIVNLDNIVSITDLLDNINNNNNKSDNSVILPKSTDNINENKNQIKSNINKNVDLKNVKPVSKIDESDNQIKKDVDLKNVKPVSKVDESGNQIKKDLKLPSSEINYKKVVEHLPAIIDSISEKNSKTGNFLENCTVGSIENNIINLKVENLNSFTYKTLVKDLKIIEESFFEKLSVKCKISIMKNFEEIKKDKSDNKDKMIDGDHPLLMDVLDKFEGEILK